MRQYFADQLPLSSRETARDLDVIIDRRLNFAPHVTKLVSQCSTMVNLLFRCFPEAPNKVMVRLFSAIVRPALEYASPIWLPSTKELLTLLESVQRKFTRRLDGCGDLSYMERLVFLSNNTTQLAPLQHRFIVADLQLMFQALCGRLDIKSEFIPTLSYMHHTRGHCYKLATHRAAKTVGKNFVYCRRTSLWNSLPNLAFDCVSGSLFRQYLDTNCEGTVARFYTIDALCE